MREITVPVRYMPAPKYHLREISVGAFMALQGGAGQDAGLALLSACMVEPTMTVEELRGLPVSALPSLQRLISATEELCGLKRTDAEEEDEAAGPPP